MSGVDVLGAVAAAAQLADLGFRSSLATVKFLSNLKKAPQTVADATSDLEDLTSTIESLREILTGLHPSNIDQQQWDKLKQLLDKAADLAKDLEMTLRPLEGQAEDNRLQKVWRDVVSVKRQDEIAKAFSRLSHLKSSLNGLLNGLNLHVSTRLKTSTTAENRSIERKIDDAALSIGLRTESNIDTFRTETGARFDRLLDAWYTTESSVNELSAQIASLGDRLQHNTEQSVGQLKLPLNSLQSIAQNTATLNFNISEDVKCVDSRLDAFATKFEASSRQTERLGNATVTKVEEVRDIIDALTTAHQVSLEISRCQMALVSSSLDEVNKTVRSLVRNPAALAQFYDHVESWDEAIRTNPLRRKRMPEQITCLCRSRRGQQSKRPARRIMCFTQKQCDRREPGCALNSTSGWSSSYTFRIPLLPLLSKTVEFVFMATHANGGFSFSSSVRYYPTAKRSTLPAFALLDAFTARHQHHLPPDTPRPELKSDLLLLFEKMVALTVDPAPLIRALAAYGVDVEATERNGWTALGYVMGYKFNVDECRLEWTLTEVGCQVPSIEFICYPSGRASNLQNTRTFPGYQEAFDLGPLEVSALDRSGVQLKKLLMSGWNPDGDILCTVFENPDEIYDVPLTPLECALGWPDGLTMLLDAGANGRTGLGLAAALGDEMSFNLILGSSTPMFLTNSHKGVDRSFTHRSGSPFSISQPACVRNLVAALKESRNQLQDLSVMHNVLMSDDIKEGPILDKGARFCYDQLISKGVEVPKRAWPGHQCTIYHLPELSHTVAGELYTAGFTEIDEPDEEGLRPIHISIRELQTPWTPWAGPVDSINMASWLTLRGASIILQSPFWPSILFYLAGLFKYHQNSIRHLEASIVSIILSIPDKSLTDNCDCYCSTTGCLPVHIYLKDRSLDCFMNPLGRRQSVEYWSEVCR
ncbi:hypothetical protein NA57DRAFT_56666 [Rhizodiscina lignyota]|uniref:Fungal N-terminal domain-containing protein n=1 Tax=Rhizodiscina lignyota TaxID=1504668 RepID=A0A9P4IG74_9PEZI|nr:hypothetical protein NA57DRAFT_56666 [Rhizodiscina lignyota]